MIKVPELLAKLPGGFVGGMQSLANSYGIKLGPNAGAVEAAAAGRRR